MSAEDRTGRKQGGHRPPAPEAEPSTQVEAEERVEHEEATYSPERNRLREVMEGRTTFIIAHRLSTISLADEIVVMDRGRIVDRGAHDELLGRSRLYAEIAEFGYEDVLFLQHDLEEREEAARL